MGKLLNRVKGEQGSEGTVSGDSDRWVIFMKSA